MDKDEVLAWLKRDGTEATIKGMARYGIPSENAFGVTMGTMLSMAKKIGKDHDLAEALWQTGIYEARMLASMVDDPELVTLEQMDAWAADWDNWAICDTVCFKLFSDTPFAWEKALEWAPSSNEFVKRGGFVMMACLTRNDVPDDEYLAFLRLTEEGAQDERNFVKKGVNWALRQIGKRNLALNAAALEVAQRLALSPNAAPRWIGKDATREISNPKVRAKLDVRVST